MNKQLVKQKIEELNKVLSESDYNLVCDIFELVVVLADLFAQDDVCQDKQCRDNALMNLQIAFNYYLKGI